MKDSFDEFDLETDRPLIVIKFVSAMTLVLVFTVVAGGLYLKTGHKPFALVSALGVAVIIFIAVLLHKTIKNK